MTLWPCTQCGGSAEIGYSASKDDPDGDWGGCIKAGERLCTECFEARGGKPFLRWLVERYQKPDAV